MRDLDADYEGFCNIDPERVEWVSAFRTRNLIHWVARQLGYNERCWSLAGSGAAYYGCPSRLTVRTGGDLMCIVYDPDLIATGGLQDEPRFSTDKRIAKVLLHECAHAVLHLHKLHAISAEDEQEAWFWAMAIWGVLTGDHAKFSRENDPWHTDRGVDLA